MPELEDYSAYVKYHGLTTNKKVTFNGPFLNKGGGVYDVKHYGAKGDGVTDDTEAVQDAIDAVGDTGGTVFFPPGTYLISDTLTYNKASSTKSHPAPSLIGSPGRSGPSMDFVANQADWPAACSVMLKASSTFPLGEYLIDWIGPTAQDRSISGFRISGFVIDCNGRTAGIRSVNPFSASFADLVLSNDPATPNPAYEPSGLDSSGAFAIMGSPTQNSFHNTIERVYIQDAALDGMQLASGSGAFDLINMCCVNNSGRYGYRIEDKCTLVNCLAQANALTSGQSGADFKVGRYNVTLIGCVSFSGKPKYGNGIRMDGGTAAVAHIIGCTFYGAENPSQNLAADIAAIVRVGGALQNAEFVGCHFITGVSTFTSHFVYVSASASGRVTFADCQFITEQGSALTGARISANGKENILSFLNCHGLNPLTTTAKGNITGAVTFDRKDGHIQTGTLTGDITVTLTAGNVIGDELTLKFTQDGTGNRTITWPSNFKKGGGTLTLSTGAAAVDTIVAKWDGTNWVEVSRALNLS